MRSAAADTALPIVFLLVVGAGALVVAAHVATRLGRWTNFRTLLVANVVVVNAASGVAHLWNSGNETSRGYFNLLSPTHNADLNPALTASALSILAVSVAVLHGLPNERPKRPEESEQLQWLTKRDAKLLLLALIPLTPAALYASARISSYAATLDQTRIIAVDEGLARYSFMSNWTVWTISIVTILLVASPLGRSSLRVAIIGGCGVALIVASLAWTGGRSIIVVMTLPLLLTLLPRMRGTRLIAMPIAILGLLNYVSNVSARRSTPGTEAGIQAWVDWQWGRFSMIGFGHNYASEHGLLLGETFLSGAVGTGLGILRLIGLPVQNPDLLTANQVTGATLLNSKDLTHIVPGIASELYMNFGLIGVTIGFFLLGRLAVWTDRRFSESRDAISQLFWAYIGTLLVFRTVAAESGAMWTYLFYAGAPILALFTVTRLSNPSRSAIPARAGARQ